MSKLRQLLALVPNLAQWHFGVKTAAIIGFGSQFGSVAFRFYAINCAPNRGWKRNLESRITAKKSEGIMNHIISQAVNRESWAKNK